MDNQNNTLAEEPAKDITETPPPVIENNSVLQEVLSPVIPQPKQEVEKEIPNPAKVYLEVEKEQAVKDQPKQEAHPNLNAGNPAPEGNKYAMKFKTPESRMKMVDDYCNHIKQGYSDESFPGCDPQTFKKYQTEFPKEFDIEVQEKIRSARAERRLFLERMGMNGTIGIPATYKSRRKVRKEDGTYEVIEEQLEAKGKFNDRSWKFIMSNITGWKDKTDVTSNDEAIKMPTVFIPKEIEGEEE